MDEAFVQRDQWRPPETSERRPRIDAAPTLLASCPWSVADRLLVSGRAREQPGELVHGGLLSRADIQRADGRRREREQVRARDVLDVDEVARLLAVAVDDGLPSSQHLVEEDGHHARLAERVVARSVHARIARR